MIPTSACFKSSAPQPESGGREGGKCFLQLGFLVWDNYVCRFLDYLITYYEHKNHCKVWIWIWIGSGWSSELSTGYTHGQSHFSVGLSRESKVLFWMLLEKRRLLEWCANQGQCRGGGRAHHHWPLLGLGVAAHPDWGGDRRVLQTTSESGPTTSEGQALE